MNTKKSLKFIFGILLLGLFVIPSSCNKEQNENVVPNVPVHITVNLDLPLYYNLRFPGNYVYLEGGNKGITLFHGFDDEYYATDRTCPYLPFEDCSRVELDSNFTFRCGHTRNGVFEKCCDSKFQYDGILSNGPAEYPLKTYRIFKSGNIIDISN